MIALEKAGREASEIVDKHLERLEAKYKKVEHNADEDGFSLKCSSKIGDSISLRMMPDRSSGRVNFPRSSAEYHKRGGHKALAEEFKKLRTPNPDAWLIKILRESPGQNFEIAPILGQHNWSAEDFEAEFLGLFL